ncbi:MAG: hypothetical protein JWQ40_3424 [Segetibacter sp.]|nr:hypothetical protein [Segetibacter sp.]
MPFFTWLTIYTAAFFHPFYISMTEINYNNKSKALEVSVRIFTDDFEKTLRKNCNCKVDLLAQQDKNAMEKLVNAYVLKHLQIKVNGQLQNLEFAGYQQEEESTWNYFVVRNVTGVNKMEITNSLLHDYRPEQINMLHIMANGKEQSDKLDYPKKNYAINF